MAERAVFLDTSAADTPSRVRYCKWKTNEEDDHICYITRNLPLADADVHVLQLTRVDVLAILEIVQRVEHAIVHLR